MCNRAAKEGTTILTQQHGYSPRSLFVAPQPNTIQGHTIMLSSVNATAGIPSTTIWNIDSSLAPKIVHLIGSLFSSSCMFAHPVTFLNQKRRISCQMVAQKKKHTIHRNIAHHQRKCSGNAPSSTIALQIQQKWVPQEPHFIWLHPPSFETGMPHVGHGFAPSVRLTYSVLARSSSTDFLWYAMHDERPE